MTLIFIFPVSEACKNYQDLMQLDKMKIDLSSYNCTVKMVQDDQETTLDGVSGKLYFKRAQLLSIDDQMNRIILSGTFDLQLLKDGFPVTISNGRFDVGITKKVFFSY
jgi:hypothetical protein